MVKVLNGRIWNIWKWKEKQGTLKKWKKDRDAKEKNKNKRGECKKVCEKRKMELQYSIEKDIM